MSKRSYALYWNLIVLALLSVALVSVSAQNQPPTKPELATGALDPNLVGRTGPVVVPTYEKAVLDGAVSKRLGAQSRPLSQRPQVATK